MTEKAQKAHPKKARPGSRAAQAEKAAARKAAFLDAYGKAATVLAAAQIVGIPRRQHYKWLAADEAYATAFGEAEQDASDRLEHEARRRAVQGIEEPVYGTLPGDKAGSGVVGTVRKYSDTLLIFLLKGARPEKYRERWQGELTGKDGAPLPVPVLFFLPDNSRK